MGKPKNQQKNYCMLNSLLLDSRATRATERLNPHLSIAFLQKVGMNVLATSRPRVLLYGHTSTSGSWTAICPVCQLKRLLQSGHSEAVYMLVSGNTDMWRASLQHANSSYHLLLSLLCPLCFVFFFYFTFYIRPFQLNWFCCTLAITILFSFQKIFILSQHILCVMVTRW